MGRAFEFRKPENSKDGLQWQNIHKNIKRYCLL